MTVSSNQKQSNYWKMLEITPDDLQHLTNHLFETEEPLTINELASVLVTNRLESVRLALASRVADAGIVDKPANSYEQGDKVRFPELDDLVGIVLETRVGINPAMGDFQVVRVEFEDGSQREFASDLKSHELNEKDYTTKSLADQDPQTIIREHGKSITTKLRSALDNQTDLIRIGYTWFPHSLLIDLGAGYLNIAEAILDSMAGGPLTIEQLMAQLEISDETENKNLLAFSLNYAVQEDPRCD